MAERRADRKTSAATPGSLGTPGSSGTSGGGAEIAAATPLGGADGCCGGGCGQGRAAADGGAPAPVLRDLPGAPPVIGEPDHRGPDRRQSVVDRRTTRTGLERRRGPGRRRSDFAKSAEEGEMNPEQFLFVMAIDAYKRVNQKPYPTWTEVLEVIRKLGYRKTQPMELGLTNSEDWTEPADAPAFAAPTEGRETITALADEAD